MMRWIHYCLLFALLCLLSVAGYAAESLISDELDTPQYDCLLTVTPAPAPVLKPLQLALETGAASREVLVTVEPKALRIETGNKGRRTTIGQAALALTPGQPGEITLLRRNDWLGVLVRDQFVWRGTVARQPGKLAEWRSTHGWTITRARVQRLEPVVFADNFMRTAEENGPWTLRRGTWKLQSAWDADPKGGSRRFVNQSYAQNPFAWVGSAATGVALCTAGAPHWEDYALTAAVQAPRAGAVGLLVNMSAADTGLLVRWTPVTDRTARGNRLALIALDQGRETLLDVSPGGYLPGQWYRLSVISTLAGVRVLVDGQQRLTKADVSPRRGGIGLYAEGEHGVIFDDVTAYGRTLKASLLNEHRQAQIARRFVEDKKGMATWASAGNDWQPLPKAPEMRGHRLDFYGDHGITLTTQLTAAPTGTLCLLLHGDGQHADRGYRAVLAREGGEKMLTVTLYRDAQRLSTGQHPLDSGEAYTVRFRHAGAKLLLEIDGETVLTTDATPLPGLRPAYAATGCFTVVGDVYALGDRLLDYSFADAPVDWLAEGTWMPTTRWSCSSQWSFLGGWSRGDAVLWHKQRFDGDQFLQAYLGVKMEYPRERQDYWSRFRDLAITICGDGHDPRTGYAGIIAASEAEDRPNQRTVLLRNGVQVASVDLPLPMNPSKGHTHWFQLELRKHGATVELWADGQRAVAYTDPAPLTGGVPGVWTHDNGLSLARVRLGYAQPPTLRTDPQVTMDDPWYPAWANVGRPLTLEFSQAVSTAAAPLRLQVTKRQAPEGATALPQVTGLRLTLTPPVPGKYWYQVNATDGEHTSPAFHLAVPVFTPALGRDDTDAVVLYRFDEGAGAVIHDHGVVTPPADLTIHQEAAVQWLPGQGLTIHGPGRIMSAPVPKLMEIVRRNACTLEMWMETDTIFAPTYWLGGLLAWEKPNEQRNFALAHVWRDITVAPYGTTFNPRSGGTARFRTFRTGLQHLVITWDGTVTRAYLNGRPCGEARVKWQPDRWSADAPLIVGSLAAGQPNYALPIALHNGIAPYIIPQQTDMEHCYLGSLYLTAIHRRCLTPEDILRHYQAGPSAR